jgi:hypothetical protein
MATSAVLRYNMNKITCYLDQARVAKRSASSGFNSVYTTIPLRDAPRNGHIRSQNSQKREQILFGKEKEKHLNLLTILHVFNLVLFLYRASRRM